MIEVLFVAFFLALGYSVAYGGRFRYPSVPGSLADRVYGWINIAANVAMALVGLSLPVAADFSGLPALAWGGSACVVTALLLYPVKQTRLDLLVLRPRGRRAEPLAEGQRTRWPYQYTYGLGVLAYRRIPVERRRPTGLRTLSTYGTAPSMVAVSHL